MNKNKISIRFVILSLAVAVAVVIVFSSQAFAKGGEEEEPEAPAMMMMQGSTGDSGAVPPPGVLGGDYMKPAEEELRETLSDIQYDITQLNGTERAFSNEFFDEKRHGIYVDVVSGEPLFGSLEKYKSGTGWPSFFEPLEDGNIVEVKDLSHGMVRIEVRSYFADSHLGHLFNDGPEPTGPRYCINSAALRFIPVEDLEKEGYGRYLPLFDEVS